MQKVGIIGGAGFIGSYVTKIFLEKNYQVKVSSTDISNKNKYQHLQSLPNADNLEICALDVRDSRMSENFVNGCEIVIHAGSPFVLDVKDPKTQLFDPTVMGTRNLLETIKKAEGLAKVVFVASVAAWNTSFPLKPSSYPDAHIFTESDTPFMSEKDHPYSQSKFLADQAVRKFIYDFPDLPFEITSISPAFVIGNSLSARQDSTSVWLQRVLKNKVVPNSFIEMLYELNVVFSLVDVRDVAEAIYQAAMTTGIHGKNYLIANDSYAVSDISRMLNNEEPVGNPALIYVSALAKKELEIAFIAAKETLNHCVL